MTQGHRTSVRTHRVDVPDRVRDTSDFRKADYSTVSRLDGGPAASPQQWGRGCLEGAPGWLRVLLVFGWRHVLRLRLGPPATSGTVLGWFVVADEPDFVTISAGSPLLEAQHHFLRDDTGVTWVTVVRTHTRLGRILWRCIAPGHELTMPLLLRRAARRIG